MLSAHSTRYRLELEFLSTRKARAGGGASVRAISAFAGAAVRTCVWTGCAVNLGLFEA